MEWLWVIALTALIFSPLLVVRIARGVPRHRDRVGMGDAYLQSQERPADGVGGHYP